MQNTPFYALFCFKSLQIRGVKPGFEYCFIVLMQVGRFTKVLTGWLLSKCDPSVRPYIGSRAWGSPKMNLLELVQRKEEGDVNSAEMNLLEFFFEEEAAWLQNFLASTHYRGY